MLNTREKNTKTKHSGGASAELQRFLLKTVLLLAAGIFLFTCVLEVKRAEGNTMSPFVRDGDLCIFLRTEHVSLGEVVIYRDPTGRKKIGRVVGIGGQTIDFPENGGYTLDGYQPSEEVPYETYAVDSDPEGSDEITETEEDAENTELKKDTEVRYPLKLSEQEVFLLNDFRSLTDDSRTFGPINLKNIDGKLFFLLRRRGF